jgi:hypothetical protein
MGLLRQPDSLIVRRLTREHRSRPHKSKPGQNSSNQSNMVRSAFERILAVLSVQLNVPVNANQVVLARLPVREAPPSRANHDMIASATVKYFSALTSRRRISNGLQSAHSPETAQSVTKMLWPPRSPHHFSIKLVQNREGVNTLSAVSGSRSSVSRLLRRGERN